MLSSMGASMHTPRPVRCCCTTPEATASARCSPTILSQAIVRKNLGFAGCIRIERSQA